MKNTPGWVIIVCGTAIVLTFGGFTFWMSVKGVDDTQFRGYIILLGTLFNTLLSGGAFLASSATQKQTNGDMAEGIKTHVREALEESKNAD